MDLASKKSLALNERNSARGLRERAEISLEESKACDARAEKLEAEIAAEEKAAAKAGKKE